MQLTQKMREDIKNEIIKMQKFTKQEIVQDRYKKFREIKEFNIIN